MYYIVVIILDIENNGSITMTTERMMIQLSETAEILLTRIVESRFGVGAKSSILYDSTIEHLIHEEARKLKVTDQDLEAKE